MRTNLTVKQNLILDYLRQGCFIGWTHDLRTSELSITLMDESEGGSHDILAIQNKTLQSLLKRGYVKEVECHPRALELDRKMFVLNDTE